MPSLGGTRRKFQQGPSLDARKLVAAGVVALITIAEFAGAFSALGLPEPAQVSCVILLIAATLWVTEAIPLFATSFVILLLAIVWLGPTLRSHDQQVSNAVFLAPFFSDVILLFLGGFSLAAALQKFRLDEQLASVVVAHAGNSVPRLMIAVMAITAFLSMWLSNSATAAMMLALCLPIIRGLPADDDYRKALLLAVPFAANIGGLGTPIGSPPNAIAMQYMRQWSLDISFAKWMLVGVPGVCVMLCVCWGVLMLLYRGMATVPVFEARRARTIRGTGTTFVMVVTALTVLGWLTEAWHGHTAGTVALIPVIGLFGARLLDVKDLQSLPWEVLLMMGGGLSLGATIAESGLAEWAIARLDLGGSELFAAMIIFGAAAAMMSSVMSNTATANLVMPLIAGLGAAVQAPLLVAVAFSCSLAMPLPISTPPNAIAFSSGELTVVQMLKAGALITVLGLVLAFTTGYLWWGLVGLY